MPVRKQLEHLLAAWPDDRPAFLRACSQVRNWDSLIEGAAEHGVLGVLRAGLVGGDSPISPEQKVGLERHCVALALMQSRLIETLETALYALAQANVPAVALKGPALSQRLYGDATLRPATDLDLLVAPAKLSRAIEALRNIGFEALAGKEEEYFRQHHHHVHLRAANRPTIELHFRLSSAFGVFIPAEPFLERSLPYRTTQGAECRVLAPEDELIYLAVHAAAHAFARLSWLYDLKMLGRSCPNLDWSLVCQRAAAVSVLVPLLFSADVLRRRLGVALEKSGVRQSAPIRRGLGRLLLPVVDSLPDGGLLAKCANLAYEAALSDRASAIMPLCRRRFAHWRTL
jgi:hypothetical protein